LADPRRGLNGAAIPGAVSFLASTLGSDPTWYDQKQEIHAVQNVSIQKASELSPSVKSAVEQLLGRPIEADEEVSVAAVPPQQIPPSENRAVVAEKLEAFLNRRATKVRDISDEELDTAVDEAVDHVRHSRR
jgi:hypothetical protein